MYEYDYNPLTDEGPPPDEIEAAKRKIRQKWSEGERASRIVGGARSAVRWTPPTIEMKSLIGESETRAYTRIA